MSPTKLDTHHIKPQMLFQSLRGQKTQKLYHSSYRSTVEESRTSGGEINIWHLITETPLGILSVSLDHGLLTRTVSCSGASEAQRPHCHQLAE